MYFFNGFKFRATRCRNGFPEIVGKQPANRSSITCEVQLSYATATRNVDGCCFLWVVDVDNDHACNRRLVFEALNGFEFF
ncbi:hypothetical protein DSECCO2_596740 [anaerobic digester metagenome]